MNIISNQEHQRFFKNYHMEIPLSGLASFGNEWKQKKSCSPFSRLYYILQGEGILYLETDTVPLKAGKVYLLPAGLTYGYDCPDYMEQLFFHINYTYMNGIDLFNGCRTVYSRDISKQELEHLKKLYLSETLSDSFQLKAFLVNELADFVCMAQPIRSRNYSTLIQQVFLLAQNPVNVNNRVSVLAQKLHVAPSTLGKHFQLETGKTLGEYMAQLVISRACTLLIDNSLSIACIAEELGFSDQFYFAKYFKKHMLVAPSLYRKQMKG